jgi:hypothetical protein
LDGSSYRHVIVEENGEPKDLALDPVVEQALRKLTSFVFRRRRFSSFRHEKRRRGLGDPGPRAGAVHTFKHLKHHGYSFEPEAVALWARDHGWNADDANELSAYAAGVLAGKRYHTSPDPFGMTAINRWRAEVKSKD